MESLNKGTLTCWVHTAYILSHSHAQYRESCNKYNHNDLISSAHKFPRILCISPMSPAVLLLDDAKVRWGPSPPFFLCYILIVKCSCVHFLDSTRTPSLVGSVSGDKWNFSYSQEKFNLSPDWYPLDVRLGTRLGLIWHLSHPIWMFCTRWVISMNIITCSHPLLYPLAIVQNKEVC